MWLEDNGDSNIAHISLSRKGLLLRITVPEGLSVKRHPMGRSWQTAPGGRAHLHGRLTRG